MQWTLLEEWASVIQLQVNIALTTDIQCNNMATLDKTSAFYSIFNKCKMSFYAKPWNLKKPYKNIKYKFIT